MATQVARQLVGDPDLEIELISANTWTVNNMYAMRMQEGRVFIMGDAAHRHPPSNGLGSNTSIQDSFNLAWKLAAVLKGQATPALLDTYTAERAPVAKQIVTRANQSIAEFGPIFESLGMGEGVDPDVMAATKAKRCDIGGEAEAQRVEMHQRYSSDAAVSDGQLEPDFELDADLHYQPTTWPGARIPHVWVFDRAGGKHSTLDLCGKGRFALFTGIGGEDWRDAVETLSAELGLDIDLRVIGPRQDWLDHTGDWARAREIGDTGCLLVRPDQHVAWRVAALPEDPAAELRRVLRQILGHDTVAKTEAAREMADA